jgi:hypothetical protein
MNIVIPYEELAKYNEYIKYDPNTQSTEEWTKYSINKDLSFANMLDLFQSQQTP